MKTVLRNPWVRFIGLLVLIFLGLRVVHAIRGVLIPFSLALVAAYIFDPVVDWLQTKRVRRVTLGRGGAVAVLVLLLAGAVALFVFVAVPHAVRTTGELVTGATVEKVINFLPENIREVIERLRTAEPEQRAQIVQQLLGDFFASERRVTAVGEGARAVAFTALSALLWVFNFFLFFVVTIYLLMDIDRIRAWARSALPLRYKDDTLRIAKRLDVDLKAFFRGQCVVVLILSLIFTVGLALVGCPFWYLVGVVGGIGAFIPYFALASGMVPGMILAAAQYGNVWRPLAVAAVFGIGLAIDNVCVTPRIIGKRVGMHPVIVILSILVFGTLFGFLGVIFAVPIAAVVKVFAQELFARYKESGFYTGSTEGEA